MLPLGVTELPKTFPKIPATPLSDDESTEPWEHHVCFTPTSVIRCRLDGRCIVYSECRGRYCCPTFDGLWATTTTAAVSTIATSTTTATTTAATTNPSPAVLSRTLAAARPTYAAACPGYPEISGLFWAVVGLVLLIVGVSIACFLVGRWTSRPPHGYYEDIDVLWSPSWKPQRIGSRSRGRSRARGRARGRGRGRGKGRDNSRDSSAVVSIFFNGPSSNSHD